MHVVRLQAGRRIGSFVLAIELVAVQAAGRHPGHHGMVVSPAPWRQRDPLLLRGHDMHVNRVAVRRPDQKATALLVQGRCPELPVGESAHTALPSMRPRVAGGHRTGAERALGP